MPDTCIKAIQIKTDNFHLCYQCAKCSAGCPVAEEMDMLPHEVMHNLSLGARDKVLKSKTIWICASCYTCTVRCPNNIDITGVMDTLRNRSVNHQTECAEPGMIKFHKNFIKDIKRRGRVHESRMLAEYNISNLRPFNNILIALKMLLKNRLPLLPPVRVKGFKKWLKKLQK
ncbi:MAG: 4Fe-4S dicluster domain-containing protein [bacterium]